MPQLDALSLDALDDALARIEQLAADGQAADRDNVSFGITQDVIPRLETMFDRLLRTVSHYAWTESPFATTAVSYSGSMYTVCAADSDVSLFDAHLGSLDQALRLKTKLIRIIIAAAQLALAISISVASPAGLIIALNSAGKLATELQRVNEIC